MKNKLFVLLGLLCFVLTVNAAQPVLAPSPTSDIWKAAIALCSTIVVYFVGRLSFIPRPVLPTLAPIIGLGSAALLNAVHDEGITWVSALMAGGAGVAVREVYNQWFVKRKKPAEASKTNAAPVDGAVAVASTMATSMLMKENPVLNLPPDSTKPSDPAAP